MTAEERQREVEEYLSKIRKTIADSRALVEQAELRIAETDRMLAAEGLTREEVLNYRFTPEQRMAVNEELRRRGLPPMEDDEESLSFDAATAQAREDVWQPEAGDVGGEDLLEARRRKFGNFMQAYRL